MKVFKLLQRGTYHPTNCEDFILTTSIYDDFNISAVMDGCSNGKDSHFASALMGKLIAKVAHHLPHLVDIAKFNSAQALGKQFLKQLFEELKMAREQLFLNWSEMLSTLILAVYDCHLQDAFIISLGDGIIGINGEIHSIDQQNMPDYMSYHLSKDFEEWFASQKHIFHVKQPAELSISTDGIESFMTKNFEYAAVNVHDYLLNDRTFSQHKNMLGKKVQILYAEYGIAPQDDLGIIRMIF